MNNVPRILLGLMIVTSLVLSASPAAAASYGSASGSGDFYADDTGTVTPGGRVHFTFIAKIKDKGPAGQIEFRYPLDNLKIKSTAYNYVSFNGNEVTFAGSCVKDGQANCSFVAIAYDGDVDYFEIQVLAEGGTSVYKGFLAGGKIEVSPP